MPVTRPYKDRPWIVLTTSSWWEDLLCLGYYRFEVDTTHPEWTRKVLLPKIIKARERALSEKEVKNMTFIEQRKYLDNRIK